MTKFMPTPIPIVHYWLGGMISVLLVLAAGAGVVDKEIYSPFLSETLVGFQFSQDLLSLLFAPCLLVLMYLAQRGSLRALILWAGILLFVAYYYSFYGFGYVFTVFYPVYLALMGLSFYSLIGIMSGIDRNAFCAAIRPTIPVRLVSVVLGITAIFVPIWMSMILQRIATQEVETTDLVFVLDLAYLIPLCLYAAVRIWRRAAIGYVLSGPLLFKATVSGVLLTGGELMKWSAGVPLAIDQLSMYIFLGVIGMVALVRYLRAVDEQSKSQVHNAPARTAL